jgi:hypothetical protein
MKYIQTRNATVSLMISSMAIVAATFSVPMASAETQKLNSPKVKGVLLDWCWDWGEIGCGKRVATAYCKSQGFKRSVGYKKWEDPGRPTQQISNGSVCDASYCDSFRFVMCEK